MQKDLFLYTVAEKFDLIENNKQTQCIIFYDDVQFLEENDNSSNSQNRNELLTQLSYLEEKKNVKILMSLSTTENNQFDLEQVLVDCNFYRQYKNMPQFNAKDAKKLLIDNIEEQFLQVIRGQFDHILDEFIELLPKVPNQIIQQAKQFKNTNKLVWTFN
ncbi:hypothetical protein PPERSA_10372 [Pseudocohnilembus persalinus]|uniref:Uncharacterized protein n=1 Tax=Pseudocohnilembus persalinus TaxID=266149 RepID=A0A0V0QNN8_PSEPJ|nr:hypothetical protein PPERSA_10372 [Pseudocohnilembus persalinus]|eukprot:KRX03688.1 hypothetical protein PPERSA_10372 [Pseudocohnilembus persalinus]